MLLRTKLHGKTYELLETGGFDTSFAKTAQSYSTTEVKMILSSFLLSSLFTPLRSSRLRGEKR